MNASSSSLPPRPCGLCGHDVNAHSAGEGRRSRYCAVETCDCGEFISPLPFGRRWKWSDEEIRRNLQQLAGLNHLQPEPANQTLERFAFGDGYVVDFREPPKHKSDT